MTNWQEQFDKEFDIDYDWENTFDRYGIENLKTFIQSLLDQQNQELLEKIKLEKKPTNPLMPSVCLGYNQAVSDLEALKKSLSRG